VRSIARLERIHVLSLQRWGAWLILVPAAAGGSLHARSLETFDTPNRVLFASESCVLSLTVSGARNAYIPDKPITNKHAIIHRWHGPLGKL